MTRWLIRTERSGVWLAARILTAAEAEAEGRTAPPVPGAIPITGRRCHRWSGSRLACGDLAREGAWPGDRIEAESHPWLLLHDIAEIHEMPAEAVERTLAVPVWVPRGQ